MPYETTQQLDIMPEHSRIYRNGGNAGLLALLGSAVGRILDVGCGAGDNARILRSKFPTVEVQGVTHSTAEAALAENYMTVCHLFDIEGEIPDDLQATDFDVIIFSHVLEHMRDPAAILQKFSKLLKLGGCVLIAVPNTLSYAMRWQFLRGDFEYRSDGILDDTHLRFFTYRTADKYLLGKSPELRLASKTVNGSVPQWWFRRYFLPTSWCAAVDVLGCHLWPNLFGEQVLIKAIRSLPGTAISQP